MKKDIKHTVLTSVNKDKQVRHQEPLMGRDSNLSQEVTGTRLYVKALNFQRRLASGLFESLNKEDGTVFIGEVIGKGYTSIKKEMSHTIAVYRQGFRSTSLVNIQIGRTNTVSKLVDMLFARNYVITAKEFEEIKVPLAILHIKDNTIFNVVLKTIETGEHRGAMAGSMLKETIGHIASVVIAEAYSSLVRTTLLHLDLNIVKKNPIGGLKTMLKSLAEVCEHDSVTHSDIVKLCLQGAKVDESLYNVYKVEIDKATFEEASEDLDFNLRSLAE